MNRRFTAGPDGLAFVVGTGMVAAWFPSLREHRATGTAAPLTS